MQAGTQLTVYLVIVAPPLLTGGEKATVAVRPSAVAVTHCGAPGLVIAANADDAENNKTNAAMILLVLCIIFSRLKS